MTAIQYLDGEAMRAAAAHAMARLHQRFDLVLCPTVPAGPPLADAPTENPVEALWTQWAPWTFTFNLTRQPAITVPWGCGRTGCRTRCRLAAARYPRGPCAARGADDRVGGAVPDGGDGMRQRPGGLKSGVRRRP